MTSDYESEKPQAMPEREVALNEEQFVEIMARAMEPNPWEQTHKPESDGYWRNRSKQQKALKRARKAYRALLPYLTHPQPDEAKPIEWPAYTPAKLPEKRIRHFTSEVFMDEAKESITDREEIEYHLARLQNVSENATVSHEMVQDCVAHIRAALAKGGN